MLTPLNEEERTRILLLSITNIKLRNLSGGCSNGSVSGLRDKNPPRDCERLVAISIIKTIN